MKSFRGKWALVTGASSGLGAEFARALAGAGAHLIITARRQEALEALKKEIQARHPGISVEVLVQDLGAPQGPDQLKAQMDAKNLKADILINNAGFGAFGAFDQIDWEKENTMLQLDVVTLVKMTRLFAADMKTRGWGRILQLGSIGAFQPTPLYASYSAAKAFVLSYGIAVNQELRGTGVSCTVLNPGVTATEFLQVSGQKTTGYQKMVMMQAPQVIRAGLKALHRRKKSVVPGLVNKASAVLTRFIGRGLAARMAESLMR